MLAVVRRAWRLAQRELSHRIASVDALADNLRRLRRKAELTQAALADLAGIPRATCAAMEQPGANPGVIAVAAVAKALEVSIDDLLTTAPEDRVIRVGPEQQQEYRAERGAFTARLVSPITSRGVQQSVIRMLPGCISVGRPHPSGAQEFLYVVSGTALVTVGSERVEVPSGWLVQFPGHLRHVYANPGRTAVEALSTVVLHLG
jgi:quercetin dioxygenase-like cupin family protein/DNA-binding XRE family transcriptional regulator